ncbi:GntR family transcriptional regulator [Vineibacter terrae]|uniref:GntR family transcriptional regulator n=1 Tax=Vineibacter terrae TaxID=2586908 RepID=UPI002E347046|nr:GntR family transcriptional regulator [Vineibacter terrae]HEX2885205.1 GntR family transcriptional regulator [Vineibacter terrae]
MSARRALQDGPADISSLALPMAGMPSPLYHQLKQALTDQIISGRWGPGSELPSENELCAHFSVSRGTLRRALADLATHGLVSRQQGRGTFVAEAKFEGSVLASYAFYRSGAINHDRGARILKCERRPASADLRDLLDMPAREPIYELQRVQFMRKVPITLAASYFPASLVPDLEKQDLANTHLYTLLEEQYGMALLRAQETIEPVLADDYVAQHLAIAPGTPVFRIERLTYGHGDRVREVRRSYMRGDRYKLRIDLK